MKNIFLLLAFTAILFSCSKDKIIEDESPFMLTDKTEKLISIDTVKNSEVMNVLKLTGKVTMNEDRIVKIYPLVGGTIDKVNVELGEFVHKGQVLATIKSGEVASLEQQRISAESGLLIAQKNVDATEEMYKAGISSSRDKLIAKQDYQKALAEKKRIDNIFSIYNVNNEGDYVMQSPISGFVVEKNINSSMQIRPDNNGSLFTVSGLDEVWVTANVYESDISKIKEGFPAQVTTLSYPDKIFNGKVDKIFNVLDPETKVMKIRIRLKNPDYLLKPEMFANVTLFYSEEKNLPSVNASAIVFDNSKHYVMVYKTRKDIETREVQIYKTVNGKSYISEGLNPGDKIIDKYHLMIYDALND